MGLSPSDLRFFGCLILLLLGFAVECLAADKLPRSQPEAQGVSSPDVLAFVDAADRTIDSLNSFMLVRHGNVVAEGWWAPYNPEARHSLYSLSKSFTSTAVGLAIAEGKLTVNDSVLKFFPDDAPKDPSNNLKSMRVSDLLRMNTGHESEPPRKPEESWVKTFLAHPVPFKPGTRFLYNTSATYMQSAIVQQATGVKLIDYLRPRLFDPLGIEQPTWEESPQGISTGGYGLSVRTEDIAKFGQLYLQKGEWKGKQLVPAAWIAEATARQTSNGSSPDSDWDQGYGYQFWRCRHGAYRGDGAFGQYCIVLPEQDAVIAITSGVRDMQAVMNLVWDKLLPAMKPSALAANDEARGKLESKLHGLSLRTVEGTAAPAKVTGKKYAFPSNDQKLEAVSLEIDEKSGATTLTLRVEGADYRIPCAAGAWKTSHGRWAALKDQPLAASGAWTEDGQFTTKLCFFETPFTITLKLKYDGAELKLTARGNVGPGSDKDLTLTGTAGEVAQKPAEATTAGTSPTAGSPVPPSPPANAAPGHNFAQWEKEVAAYEAQDKTNPPPKGGIVFVGSSTIRLWKTLAEDFPDHKVINRGIGGSEIVDSTYYADRIIFPYEPKQIFLRAGGNDVHNGRIPDQLVDDFVEFVTKVRTKLPKAEILYIATNPAPSRWGEKDKNQELNKLIRAWALKLPRVGYVDCDDFSIDKNNQPIRDIFIEDMLHLNRNGYKLLASRVQPYLSK